jgi:hypothetical protein
MRLRACLAYCRINQLMDSVCGYGDLPLGHCIIDGLRGKGVRVHGLA